MGEEDPMDEMGDVLNGTAPPPQTPKKQNKPFRSQTCRVSMYEWPEEATKGGPRMVRDVSLYLEGNGKLWIHWRDVEWLIRCLWINQQLKGVADVASDDEGPDARESMEPDLTPDKCPRPQDAEGFLFDKWASPP